MNAAVADRVAERAPAGDPISLNHAVPGLDAEQPKGRLRAVPPRMPLPREIERLVCRGSELALRHARKAGAQPLPTGLAPLDEVLEGGLVRGAITELVGSKSCGRMATVATVLAHATACGENAALVDLGDHLDAEAVQEAGADLRRLLWLRPRRLPEALDMTELLLQAGFPLVVTDLGLPPIRGRVSSGAWIRVAREATAHNAHVLLSSPYPIAGHAPVAVVRLFRLRGRWSGRQGVSAVLESTRFSCLVLRRRGGRPGGRAHGRLWPTASSAGRPACTAFDAASRTACTWAPTGT